MDRKGNISNDACREVHDGGTDKEDRYQSILSLATQGMWLIFQFTTTSKTHEGGKENVNDSAHVNNI